MQGFDICHLAMRVVGRNRSENYNIVMSTTSQTRRGHCYAVVSKKPQSINSRKFALTRKRRFMFFLRRRVTKTETCKEETNVLRSKNHPTPLLLGN